MNPDIRDYIRANRDTYTPESIRQELLAAGHTEEAIDAAWREIDREEQGETVAAPPQQRVVATLQFWLVLACTACVALTILPTGGTLLLAFVISAAEGLGLSASVGGVEAIILSVAIFALGYLAIGLVGRWVMRRDRAAALGIFSGLATAFVLSIIVAGLCVALLQNL